MNGSVTLNVGDTWHLRAGKDRIVYAGMPTPDVYSIVQMKWEFLYRGFAWNLFFPAGQREIRVDGVNLTVEEVGPNVIRLRS
jgi:hypothetical protein